MGGGFGGFVAADVGEHGTCDNVSEHLRDPIRRDLHSAPSARPSSG
jgi:hypothetical protein